MDKNEWISIISQNQTLQNTEWYDTRGISVHWTLLGTQSSSDFLCAEWKELYWMIWHTRDFYALDTIRDTVLFCFLVCRMKGIRRNPFSYSVLASTARGPRVISYNCPTFIVFQSNQSRTAEATKFCRQSEIAIAQSPLLGLCHSSITTVATSDIMLLAMLLFIF